MSSRSQIYRFFLIPALFAGLLAPVSAADIPAACKSECTTPYGKVLGVTPSNVEAYSNCNSKCVIFEPNRTMGTYTGIKWQCVEYARRWLLVNTGMVYGDVDYAIDIWDKIQHYKRVSDEAKVPVASHLNGSKLKPQRGDLFIYAKAMFGTGHVAVVTRVDDKTGKIRLAEQNYLNQAWQGRHAREVSLVEKDGGWWVLDAYLIGWKRAAG